MDFYYYLLWCSLKNLVCCLTCLIFLKSSWWPFWTFSAQTHLNFQTNLLKVKIRKEYKKMFCGPSEIYKNISWPINICLKHFLTSAKSLRPPSYILNLRFIITQVVLAKIYFLLKHVINSNSYKLVSCGTFHDFYEGLLETLWLGDTAFFNLIF